MKILNAKQADIVAHLQVNGTIDRRSPWPILGSLLIHKRGPQIRITSSNLETQASSWADLSDADGKEAKLTVDAKKFHDVIKTISASEIVLMSLEKEVAIIKSGRAKFRLNTLPAEDFPLMAIEPHAVELTVPAETLREMFGTVAYAMAADDIRHYLRSALFEVKGNELTVVATDGHRLAMMSHVLSDNVPDSSALIPRKVVLDLHRQVAKSDEPVTVQLGKAQIRFVFGSTEVVSKLVEGRYPDYRKVIPKNNTVVVNLERERLLMGLRRAAIIVDSGVPGVELGLDSNSLRLKASHNSEEVVEELDVKYVGPRRAFGFNTSYLVETMTNIVDASLDVAFGDDGCPLLVATASGAKHVVMPMRI